MLILLGQIRLDLEREAKAVFLLFFLKKSKKTFKKKRKEKYKPGNLDKEEKQWFKDKTKQSQIKT